MREIVWLCDSEFGLWASELSRHVVPYVATYISEETAASIFRVGVKTAVSSCARNVGDRLRG